MCLVIQYWRLNAWYRKKLNSWGQNDWWTCAVWRTRLWLSGPWTKTSRFLKKYGLNIFLDKYLSANLLSHSNLPRLTSNDKSCCLHEQQAQQVVPNSDNAGKTGNADNSLVLSYIRNILQKVDTMLMNISNNTLKMH